MLHTTVARLLQAPPLDGGGGGGGAAEGSLQHAALGLPPPPSEQQRQQQEPQQPQQLAAGPIVDAVDRLSRELCGLRATFGEVWFVEEQDLLALALNGRYVRHVAPLACPEAGAGAGAGSGSGLAAAAAA